MNTEPTTIIPLDRYERDIEQALCEAYWNEIDEEVRWLQERIRMINILKEHGEEWFVNF